MPREGWARQPLCADIDGFPEFDTSPRFFAFSGSTPYTNQ
jgi:hypothetical protein